MVSKVFEPLKFYCKSYAVVSHHNRLSFVEAFLKKDHNIVFGKTIQKKVLWIRRGNIDELRIIFQFFQQKHML